MLHAINVCFKRKKSFLIETVIIPRIHTLDGRESSPFEGR